MNHTELATDDDIRNGLVYWARIFKAHTWEEIRTIAAEYQTAKEVATVMYTVNKDVSERTIFEAHRKFIESKVTNENALVRAKKSLEEKDQEIANLKKTLADKDKIISELQQKK